MSGFAFDALKDGKAAMTALALERLKAIFGADIEKEITASVPPPGAATGYRRRLFRREAGAGGQPGCVSAVRSTTACSSPARRPRSISLTARRLLQRCRGGGGGRRVPPDAPDRRSPHATIWVKCVDLPQLNLWAPCLWFKRPHQAKKTR
jgi:hypothetical protein